MLQILKLHEATRLTELYREVSEVICKHRAMTLTQRLWLEQRPLHTQSQRRKGEIFPPQQVGREPMMLFGIRRKLTENKLVLEEFNLKLIANNYQAPEVWQELWLISLHAH